MSNLADQLRDLIESVSKDEEIYAIVAEVTAVDEDRRSCTVSPVSGDPEILDVKLQSSIGSDTGLVQIPVVSTEDNPSYAIVNFTSAHTAYAALFNRIDKILIDTDLVQFNGGGNGGLVNISDLVDKINGLENALNSFINIYNLHTHSVPQAPSGATVSATPLAQSTDTIAPITTVTDLEDTKVTH
ncbi:MAG: hypothetical protein ACQ9ET_00260 [Nitrosomonadaceae bacterium]